MKADLITAWLFNEGYKHEIDSDGDVHFKYNDVTSISPRMRTRLTSV